MSARLTGTIINPDTSAVVTGTITLSPENHKRYEGSVVTASDIVIPVDEGALDFSGIVPGRYRVKISPLDSSSWSYLADLVDGDNNISELAPLTYDKPAYNVGDLSVGPQGPAGPAGRGINSISDGDGDGIATVVFTDSTSSQLPLPLGPIGPEGPTGADSTVPGPEGPQGPQGPQGETGADSVVPGPQGPEGPQGPQGPAGPEGPQGVEGPKGPQGVEGPKGDQGAQGPAGPAGMTWRGTWDSATDYVNDDSVYYAGSSYFAAGDPEPGEIPGPESTHWNALAIQGQEGPRGPQGAQGPEGPQGPKGADSVVPGPEGPEGPEGPQGPAAEIPELVTYSSGWRKLGTGYDDYFLNTQEDPYQMRWILHHGWAVLSVVRAIGKPGDVLQWTIPEIAPGANAYYALNPSRSGFWWRNVQLDTDGNLFMFNQPENEKTNFQLVYPWTKPIPDILPGTPL